jgi:hypothetical protein
MRRFTDQEVAQILATASVESARGGAEAEPAAGLSLAEIQTVASEVGIAPELIAQAAASVARGELIPTQRRTVAGIPVALSRTIELSRSVTPVEWDRIVMALRDTFDARGVVTQEGSIREWRNGNLRAVLERTATGDRLRLATRRGDAAFFPRIGAFLLSLGAVLGMLSTLPGPTAGRYTASAITLASLGVGALVRNVLVLPAWARRRREQMEQIGRTVGQLVSGSAVE